MIRYITSLYIPSYSKTLVYMLQSTEYQIRPYLSWLSRTKDFGAVMKRRQLDQTKAARLLLIGIRLGILLEILIGVLMIILGINGKIAGGIPFGVAIIIIYPFVWAYLIILLIILGRWFINGPATQQAIMESSSIFLNHPGIKIAVAGSYGKTTMKELLKTVLSEGLIAAATPANKNVSVSHAKFAKSLNGNEDVLIIEYGEGAPGDVSNFARLTHPDRAVITGLAPAHLDRYKTIEAAGEDIFSLVEFVSNQHTYVNEESESIKKFLKPTYQLFDNQGALGWQVKNVRVSLDGIDFKITKESQELSLHSGLLGRHQIGYLCFVSALALELGISKSKVIEGIAKTKPFEHRLKPYQLSGAWILDDTYNGNIEGIRAGTKLLSELTAKRKIYVTPGLVDQGSETSKVHRVMGELIADAKPDQVVLMDNSVTGFIKEGLKKAGYKGEINIQSDPLDFYTNLKHFVASGDLVLMQNDWTDNYA